MDDDDDGWHLDYEYVIQLQSRCALKNDRPANTSPTAGQIK